eukprot:2385265-Alexandrium_andersonii.AAC.1
MASLLASHRCLLRRATSVLRLARSPTLSRAAHAVLATMHRHRVVHAALEDALNPSIVVVLELFTHSAT